MSVMQHFLLRYLLDSAHAITREAVIYVRRIMYMCRCIYKYQVSHADMRFIMLVVSGAKSNRNYFDERVFPPQSRALGWNE